MRTKQRQTVNARIQKDRQKFLEILEKNPVIQIAIDHSGISKATFYRWKEDREFAAKVEAAMSEGKNLISDIAIAQLISAIKDKNFGAIKFWLTNHHQDYKNKLEIQGSVAVDHELSTEQQDLMNRALELAGLTQKHVNGI
jgi:hypothetical protein